jgi:Mg-chelatase subunit ChlD
MTIHVYPDPQTAALTLAPGAAPTFTLISQITGASVPAGAYNKMMFIRVAMFGGPAAPTLLIKAGTGAPVPISTATTAVYRSASLTDYVGDVQLVTVGEATDVFQVRMGFDQDTTETWQLGIQNNDAVSRDFTWVVADSIASTAQPWIVVTPATLPYASLVNETIDQSVQVSNKGTGTLNITSVNPALPTGFTVHTPLPLAVAPAQTQSLVLRFTAPATPPAGGLTTGTVDLVATPADSTDGTSAGHNQRVALTATTQQLEVVLLLDDSGSMSWDALANPLPPGASNSRWAELVSGANQFLDLLAHFGNKRGRFGIARFPAGDPSNPSTFDLVPMTAIPDVAGMASAETAVAAVVPLNGTPMGDGLDRVLATATSYFGTDTFNRRWLILMSDGAHNAGIHNPLEFVAPPAGTAAVGASLAERNVELFAVAYGIEGHSDVNHVLMKELAGGSLAGGQIRNVDEAGTTAATLAAALRDTIKSGLTAAVSPLDPSDVFVIGSGEALHDVVITRFDTKAAFVLSWNTSDANRLRLELITPLCEVITPENAGQGRFSEVTFRGTDRSHMYLIEPGFLEPPEPGGAATPPRSRHGTWTFVITSPPVIIIEDRPAGEGIDVEPYLYDVQVESTLRLELSQDRPTYFAGDPVTISARLTGDGRPVTGASVSLTTTLPDGSVANFLASLQIPADALARAQEELAGKDATPILVKQLAARLAGFIFDIGQHTVTIPMTDPDGTGVYHATIADTSVPEQYTFYVAATGVSDDGVPFRREAKLQTFVLVRPAAGHTSLDIHQAEPGLVQVTIIAKDQFGNVLLIDPTTPGGFGVIAPGATVGPLTSNLDGTYGTTVTFDPSSPPSIGLQFGGDQVIPPAPIPVIGALHYADRVVKSDQGQIKSANQHADPQAALGSVAGKPAGTFISLGAGGQLTVAIHDRFIQGSADDDITVFVAPDADLRSYRVEALAHRDHDHEHDYDHDHDHDHDHDWVLLGTSIGVTQSFGLRAGRLRSTAAIRITDTSGRTRDAGFTPLATPGVSVRGVGARKVGGEDNGDN